MHVVLANICVAECRIFFREIESYTRGCFSFFCTMGVSASRSGQFFFHLFLVDQQRFVTKISAFGFHFSDRNDSQKSPIKLRGYHRNRSSFHRNSKSGRVPEKKRRHLRLLHYITYFLMLNF